ncbi:DoxX family protein [Streptomyces chromofuscus]|uniref:Uncharacterized protein n=1 Tax=Streptomyces chromofuscus TaxID=42881 RepID=A0A7M2T7I1_STRCW|nr:DoxX family protein [Streptomyces chromofuscus]QOV43863.1 hypothetical protein IPT68_29950 [Streptomyces chromofuscus]GGT21266.1 hypothetical protein GCM10010254_47200 [Streptomyces chromofuscus]
MYLYAALICLIVLIFALLGVAELLALGPMPELAAHAGFRTAAYRVIGALELAGAVGVAVGPVMPLGGGLAASGLNDRQCFDRSTAAAGPSGPEGGLVGPVRGRHLGRG